MTPALVALFALGVATAAAAQSLERRVADAPDGEVRLAFASRPGVCGNGRNIISFDCGAGRCAGRRISSDWSYDDDRCGCEPGPVRLHLTVHGRRVDDVRAYVGGTWGEPVGRLTDLGVIGAREAALYLVALAARTDGKPGERAVLAATLADSADVWPDLLRLARNTQVTRQTRRAAVFWLGQAAGDAATQGLAELAADEAVDRGVRKAAVFALSQLPRSEGVPILIAIARTHRDPELRKQAIFWLAQSEDPRALALFEELLSVRR